MPHDRSGEITILLAKLRAGDAAARDRLFVVIYGRMREIAQNLMQAERADHTLQPTALANEVIAKVLEDEKLPDYQDRHHLFAAIAKAMRNLLIDHERRRRAMKRGGGWDRHPLQSASSLRDPAEPRDEIDLLDSLEALSAVHDRASQVATLRFVWGLDLPEVAEQLGVSLTTIESDWRLARAWLRRHYESAK
jgi:RNA polymerase sigma factor (TIGR02999 family)